MKSGVLLLLFSLFYFIAAEKEDTLESLIDDIFKPSASTTEKINPGQNEGAVSGNNSCKCVPYYLCNASTSGVLTDIRLSDDNPCDYLSVCCNAADMLKEPAKPKRSNKSKTCGIRNPDGVGFAIKSLIENQANFGEFPWTIGLLSEEAVGGKDEKVFVYQCVASLIHPQAVLTSAKCVSDKDKHYKVRAGEWDTQTKNELFSHQDRHVKTIIIHPQYSEETLANDVAVLILEESLDIAENVDTVCLPTQGMVVENTRCYASGWGKDVFGKDGKYSVIMKKLDLPIVSNNICEEKLRTTLLGKEFKLHSSFICAGGEVGKRDTCKGDRGSPLVCPIPGHPGKYFQAGIVSWENGCKENPIPGVYTNVAQFADWIGEQTASHNLEKSYYTY